jgi:hypothetical protein
MSLNDYYTVQVLAQHHHRDLMAAAATERLAVIALSGRPSWWRRLSRAGSRDAGTSRPVATQPGVNGVGAAHGRVLSHR